MQVTIFKNILDSKNPYYVTPELIYERIKNGDYKDKILALRKLSEKGNRATQKRDLPSICFSGKFSKRGNDFCLQHSGLVCIDFDHVKEIGKLKERICKDKYTFMCFLSPSGDGLKVVMKIPASIKTHTDSCKAITEYYNEETLDEFKDIARVCYISYDPEIYFNPKSEVFTQLIQDKKEIKQVIYPTERIEDTKDIYDRIVTWLNKSDTYQDGNKHNYLVRLAGACSRFGIPMMECENILYYEFSNKASRVDRKDITQLVNRVYSNYRNKSCTAYFEKSGKPVYTTTKKEVKKEIFDVDLTNKDIIYLDNVRQSMFEGFKTGKAKGETTYYPTFDYCWTWRKKEITFVGGIGNAGKTTMINNLCVLRALKNNWKFGVFSPEQDPPDDFYNDLIHTLVGKSTEPYHGNQMSELEYKEAMKFIEKHFFYIYPENESPTPDYINNCFEYLIKKHKIDVCIIDPFNQLDNDWKKHNRDDLYISEFLSKSKRFAQMNNVHNIIAGHPKGNLQKVNGNYEIPQVYDYAGGAMWNNKCDNILCYHRPKAQSDPSDTECYFISQKIKKRKLTGIPSTAIMSFDIYTNRFSDINGFCPFGKIEEKTEQIEITNWWDNEARVIEEPPF
jgi:twinkle protein